MYNDDSWPRPSIPYPNLDRMVMVPKEKNQAAFLVDICCIYCYIQMKITQKNIFSISEKNFEEECY